MEWNPALQLRRKTHGDHWTQGSFRLMGVAGSAESASARKGWHLLCVRASNAASVILLPSSVQLPLMAATDLVEPWLTFPLPTFQPYWMLIETRHVVRSIACARAEEVPSVYPKAVKKMPPSGRLAASLSLAKYRALSVPVEASPRHEMVC
jgi:hypothetical protein